MTLDNFKTACLQILPVLHQHEFDIITPHLSIKHYTKGESYGDNVRSPLSRN